MEQAVGAVVAACIALIGVVTSLTWQARRAREEARWREDVETERRKSELQQRRLELFTTALSYIEGGSQRRNVGLAMLAILRSELEEEYPEAVSRLMLTQMRYLLVHGSNRWEGHELANMEAMADTLLTRARPWLGAEPTRGMMLAKDIDRFLEDSKDYTEWDPRVKREDGGRPNQSAIKHFRERLTAARAGLA